MQKRWFLILNVIFLIIVVGGLIFFIWRFSINEEVVIDDECVDVHKVASYIYDACYDNSTKNIYVETKRSFDIYRLNKIRFNFFDFSNKTFEVIDVPNTNSSKAYKIYAEKNPKSLNVYLGVVKDFSSPICSEPRVVFVRDCTSIKKEDGVDVSINPLNNETPLENFVAIGAPKNTNSDLLSPNLVDRERIWKSVCESEWKCSEWEVCVNGIERRDCVDKNQCYVPTNIPENTRYCDGSCVENWECTWSECRNGFTVPDCKDLNGCGTTYSLPKKLDCDAGSDCSPNIVCEAWSECAVDYNFLDLARGSIRDLSGIKSRLCRDSNGCTASVEETKDCSINIDIYTRTFDKCGVEYLGIYNRLNNDLIARVEKSSGQADSYLNIHLDDASDSPYCDYCFDGVQNGDETDVDCGGSCQECSERHATVNYRRTSSLVRLLDWIKDIFS